MSENLETLCSRVDESRDSMLATWKLLVDRDCGSKNKAGVDAVGHDVKGILESAGFKVRFYEYPEAGNLLIAERGDTTKPFVALIGHLDTVFADGEAAKRPFTIKDGVVTGPGCLDMKGGVTVLLSAMRILNEAGWDRYPVKVILEGDEEAGHQKSTAVRDMMAEAKGALFGLNFETSFKDNSVVIERKGVATFRFDVQGIGAHVGNNPKGGRSAITEIAAKVADINSLTDYDEGTTLNVGVIGGGTVPNACAEKAFCVVDVRYKSEAGISRVRAGLKAIAHKVYLDGTHTEVTELFYFPAMPRLESSLELFSRVNKIAVEHGFPEMTAKGVGGGSDSAALTMAGVPTVCALGVKGEFNHTVREYAMEDSLFERTKLLITILCTI